MSRVHKRVLKSDNFEVQKVQKPDLFDLAATSPRLRGDQGPLGHISHIGANLTNKETRGASCASVKVISRNQFSVNKKEPLLANYSDILLSSPMRIFRLRRVCSLT